MGKLQVYNIWDKLHSTGTLGQPGLISTGNFNRESIWYFNGTLQVYSITTGNHRFRISSLSQWKKMQEKLNLTGKKGQLGTHFNGKFCVYSIWSISMGEIKVSWIWQPGLIWMGNHRFTMDSLSSWTQWERRDNQRLISTGNYKFRSFKLDPHFKCILCKNFVSLWQWHG